MSRRALLGLAAVFLVLRAITVLGAADRIGEPDAAETKLMEIGDRWIADGAPDPEGLLRAARAGRNAPHGGYLPTSLAYAAIAVPLDSQGSIGALKTVTVVGATVGFVAWVATAARLAGPAAAWALALLLLLPPPALLGGQLVAWGSHAEVPWLLGLLAWATSAERFRAEALVVGVLAGVAVAFDLLVAPLVAVVLVGWLLDRESGSSLLAPVVAAPIVGAALALTGGLGASVTETAGNEPTALLGGGASLFVESLGALVPLPWSASPVVSGCLTLLLLSALVLAWGGPEEVRWRRRLWLVAAPALFVLAVAATAPRRPAIAVRYLLPAWPLILLGVAVGVQGAFERWRAGGFALLGAFLLLGLSTAGPLLRVDRIDGFAHWDPARYTAADLGHVDYELAPGVNALLDRLGPRVVIPGPDAPDARGLAAVLGGGAADCLLLEGRHVFAPELVAERLDRIGPTLAPTERAAFYEQVGWGLALLFPGRTATRLAILSRLEPADRAAAEAGEQAATAWLR